MSQYLNIRLKIFISFSVMVCILVGGYVIQSISFDRTLSKYDHIVRVNLHKAEALALMRGYAKDVILSLALLGHPDNPATEVERLHKKFDDYTALYDREKSKYLKFSLDVDEQKHWEKVDEKWLKHIARLKDIKVAMMQGGPKALVKARADLIAELPVRNEYYQSIEKLTAFQSDRPNP